jgi:hypothetical protein
MDSVLAQSVDRVIDDFSREVGWQLVDHIAGVVMTNFLPIFWYEKHVLLFYLNIY